MGYCAFRKGRIQCVPVAAVYVERRRGVVNAGKQEAGRHWLIRVRSRLQFWRNLIEDGSVVLSLPERGFEIDGFLKGSVAMHWSLDSRTTKLLVWILVFSIPLLLDRQRALGRESVRFQNHQKEKAALSLLNLF